LIVLALCAHSAHPERTCVLPAGGCMSLPPIDIREWVHVVALAATEIAQGALGWSGCQLRDAAPAGREPNCGAYIPLVDTTESLQLALVADEAGCQAMARALFGTKEGEPPLSPADVADAV